MGSPFTRYRTSAFVNLDFRPTFTAALLSWLPRVPAGPGEWNGSTSYETNFGPPGQAAVWFNTQSSPAGCEQYRVNITSQNLDCFSGGTPTNCRYTSGWIKNTGIQSAVTTCQAGGGDCGPLLKAWEDRRPTGSSSWSCRQIYPNLGSWRDGCTAD